MKVTKNYGSYLFALAKLESLKWAKQEGEDVLAELVVDEDLVDLFVRGSGGV